MSTGWSRFAVQLQKDARLWLALMALMTAVRVTLLVVFHARLASSTKVGDLIAGLWSGLRFDVQFATLLTLPCVLLTLLCLRWDLTRLSDRLRSWWGLLVLVLTIIVAGIDIGYVGEYGNQFDQFLFGVIFDDLGAILTTIWQTYPVVWTFLGMLVLSGGLGWALLRWLRSPFIAIAATQPAPRISLCLFIGLGLTGALFAGVRGSVGRLPLQNKAAAYSPDPFINSITPTPYHALRKAIQQHLILQRAHGLSAVLPGEDLRAAGDLLFPGRAVGTDITRWTERRAPGTSTKPRHVFLLVMESYDAWPLAEAYRPLGLTDGVRELGKDGILLTNFLPASVGTMSSLSAMLTGTPDAGLYTAWLPSSRTPFPTSPAPIFKNLGYRTRFFYSGYLSWQRIGDFCRAQGFDEVIGGGAIDGGKSGNEWGVDDEHLFTYVAAQVTDDTPSFNVILTTSYHPPFDVDVYAKGFPHRAMPAELASQYDGRTSLAIFGHHWYSDRAATRFIRDADQRYPGSLYALTGDHWSRRFLNGTPTWAEKNLVPLLLYGPQVLAQVPRPTRAVGSHLDLIPTLVELCAPAGFPYHSMGENLLRPERGFGVNATSVIGPDFLAEIGEEVRIHPLPDRPLPNQLPDREHLRRLHHAWHGLAWWQLMRGQNITQAP